MGYTLLKGIRVLDLTMVFSGPIASRILADLGAEVIKIESASHADAFTRTNVYPENDPGEEPWNRGSIFHSLNAGKLGISLNMGKEEGREIFRRLVRISDVVIENFSPRVMDKWGLGYHDLREIREDIVMVSLSGLGHFGPLRDFLMFVPGMEGMSGLTNMTGYPDRPPMLSGHAYGDWLLGATGAAVLMAALYHRKKTGKGQYIDVAGREAAISHIGEIVMDASLNSRDPARTGNRHISAAPHGCYRCKGDDCWVTIAVEDDLQWRRFRDAVGDPPWTSEDRFADGPARQRNREALDVLVEAWTLEHDRYAVMDIMQKAGVPAGAVLTMKDMHLDPHLIERGFFEVIDHGGGVGDRPIPRQLPAKFSNAERSAPRAAPRFGEDNLYVFRDLLGMSGEEMKDLADRGVLGGTPGLPPGRPTRTELIEKQRSGWFDKDYRARLKQKYGETA
ncbi:MAG: Succinyl-CoA:(R)-benzylsuccinate CoA-transferase subunit BbsF [Syntrophorhabdus sp. PtaU1.Bin058]|nr:MAG: Succinyl-CoA:(R)-benzylsuccinate CoA-transferase subunit BbsF [Syntrophorhabdus sp. PtaU1.Bin058]